jgi:hypothetical protein
MYCSMVLMVCEIYCYCVCAFCIEWGPEYLHTRCQSGMSLFDDGDAKPNYGLSQAAAHFWRTCGEPMLSRGIRRPLAGHLATGAIDPKLCTYVPRLIRKHKKCYNS